MEWAVAGFLFAAFNAATMLVNQYYKLDGHLLSGLRGMGVALAAAPFLFFVEVPTQTRFWVLALAEAVLSSFFNSRLYASSARYGAGATSRISVLAVVFGVIFWWIYDFRQLEDLYAHPVILLGIVVSLALAIIGAVLTQINQRSNHDVGGKTALWYMMPAVLTLSAMMIIRKEIMQSGEFLSVATYYCVVTILLSGLLNMLFYAEKSVFVKTSKRAVPKARIIALAAIAISATSFLTVFFGNLASFRAPNPAYVTAITLVSPLLVTLYNKLNSVEDKFNPVATAVMFVGIAALIFFADLPISPPTSSVLGNR